MNIPLENENFFGDTSANGVAACRSAVVRRVAGINCGSLVELVAGHMAVSLITIVREAFEGLPLTSIHCWLDSLVAV